MTKEVLITLLKKGETGNEILEILDCITSNLDNEEITEEIEF